MRQFLCQHFVMSVRVPTCEFFFLFLQPSLTTNTHPPLPLLFHHKICALVHHSTTTTTTTSLSRQQVRHTFFLQSGSSLANKITGPQATATPPSTDSTSTMAPSTPSNISAPSLGQAAATMATLSAVFIIVASATPQLNREDLSSLKRRSKQTQLAYSRHLERLLPCVVKSSTTNKLPS